ncbi:MAG: metallophosphoesterase, partial [Planctomycetota bacterium]
VQLDYAKRNPGSRFKMPARWYRVDLPGDRPLVALIALDSNPGRLKKERWAEQTGWLEAVLPKAAEVPWTVAFAHHPLFSDSAHGDDEDLQRDWGPHFKRHGVDFYLAGHDHALQHLQMPEWATSFLVSGGGGYDTYEIEEERAAFARSAHGFVHLQFTAERCRVTFVDPEGKTLHRFERTRAGKVTIGEGAAGTR